MYMYVLYCTMVVIDAASTALHLKTNSTHTNTSASDMRLRQQARYLQARKSVKLRMLLLVEGLLAYRTNIVSTIHCFRL